jgi:hypothetical protein
MRWTLLLAAGCGAPISNQVFLEEALFRGVLPSEARLEAPRAVELAPRGDAGVLAAAKEAAAQWQGLVEVAVASGEQLREAEPVERTDVARRWERIDVVTNRVAGGPLGFPDDTARFWVEAEILQPDDGSLEWTIAVAADEDGPYELVGEGEDDGEGAGSLTWDLALTASALGTAPPEPLGTLELTYEPPADGEDREVLGTHTAGALVEPYVIVGDYLLGFTGELDVTGAPLPGGATVVHGEEGGRAEGVVFGEPEIGFRACWDAAGTLVWQAVDGGETVGVEASCPLADPFAG